MTRPLELGKLNLLDMFGGKMVMGIGLHSKRLFRERPYARSVRVAMKAFLVGEQNPFQIFRQLREGEERRASRCSLLYTFTSPERGPILCSAVYMQQPTTN